MGKRSSFERIEKDQYNTIDPKAAMRLDTFLPAEYTYAEPCCGEGHLISQLRGACLFKNDINGGCDALTIKDFGDVDYIITNPPWSRHLLHPMIEHFASIKPTFLLFDADWMHTKQAKPFISSHCTDIISVGRLKWIPGTNMTGKDNCCWYRFDSERTRTRFWI